MNIRHITFAFLAMLGSSIIQTSPASILGLALGTTAGYHATTDITNSINQGEHGAAAEQTVHAVMGGALMARTGLYLRIWSEGLKVSVPQPTIPGTLDSFAANTARTTSNLARSMHAGGRSMLLFPVLMAGYQY